MLCQKVTERSVTAADKEEEVRIDWILFDLLIKILDHTVPDILYDNVLINTFTAIGL